MYMQIILSRQQDSHTFSIFLDGVVCFMEVEFDRGREMDLIALADEVAQSWTI